MLLSLHVNATPGPAELSVQPRLGYRRYLWLRRLKYQGPKDVTYPLSSSSVFVVKHFLALMPALWFSGKWKACIHLEALQNPLFPTPLPMPLCPVFKGIILYSEINASRNIFLFRTSAVSYLEEAGVIYHKSQGFPVELSLVSGERVGNINSLFLFFICLCCVYHAT